MRKGFIFLLLISSLVFISCEDQVNPKGELKDITALNCIIRGDTSLQIATLSHSYNVSGFDPYENKTDPCIKGAYIRIIYGKSTYVLKDTSSSRADTGRYNTPVDYYYTNKFSIVNSGPISIYAVLPNHKILSASSYLIETSNLYFQFKYSEKIPMDRSVDDAYKYSWDYLAVTKGSENVYYAPDLLIYYYVNNNGQKIKYTKRVPTFYASTLNDKPMYPEIQKNINYVTYDTTAIRRSLLEISMNDPQKSNYIIEKAVFRIMLLDNSLAAYYSAQKTFLDEFSVRVNQPDFTNVTGGVGVFGVYTVKTQDLYFYDDYIKSLGYSIK